MTPTNSTPAAPSGGDNETRRRLGAASVKLLAAVRHLCDREGLDYGELDRAAYQQYSGERIAPAAGRIPRSPAQARALAEWAYDGPDAASVELRLLGATLLAEQGNEGEAFNADGTTTVGGDYPDGYRSPRDCDVINPSSYALPRIKLPPNRLHGRAAAAQSEPVIARRFS